MQVKEIMVEIRKSKNYQSYAASETITVGLGDDVEKLRREAFDRCKAECERQIELDFPSKPKPEVVKRTIIEG